MRSLHLAWFAIVSPLAGAGFPEPYNSETDTTHPEPLPPAEAAAGFSMPEGFRCTVFAAEPDVQNPIAMAWDAGGRMWVAENYTFAEKTRRFDLSLRDRILVLEDTDWDGVAERTEYPRAASNP